MNAEALIDTYKDYNPFVDLVITSPPYWDAKDYEGNSQQTGYGQTFEEYIDSLKKIFTGVYNISKETASLYLIIDTIKRNDRLIRLPDELAKLLENIGWYHKDTIIWNKGKTLPWSRKGQIRNVFEYILFFSKNPKEYTYNENQITVLNPKEWWKNYPERYSRLGIIPSNIWDFTIPAQGSWGSYGDEEKLQHACPFPARLAHRMIQLSSNPNDLVFDPFAGSGVTLRVSEKLGRRYFGVEINSEYKNLFNSATKLYVDSEWNDIKKSDEEREKLLEVYKIMTTKLRCIKYAKVMLKKVSEKYPECVGILSSYEYYDKNEGGYYAELMCDFLLKQEENKDQIVKYVNEIISKAPMSKYNLSVKIQYNKYEETKIKELVKKYPYGYETFKASEQAFKSNRFIKEIPELIIMSDIAISEKDIKKIEKAES